MLGADPMPKENLLIRASDRLCASVEPLAFAPPVACVYNPLVYARAPYCQYLQRWGRGVKRVVFIGMNPGPWGMAQVGVPFGAIGWVRDWLEIDGPVGRPAREHPARPVEGFNCHRTEVSGERVWGFFAHRFGTAEAFFRDHFVANYCPLLLLEAGGANRTPDKLPVAEQKALFAACDEHLRSVAEILQPEWVIGIGRFAAGRARAALADSRTQVGEILHPSPASPIANRGWAAAAEDQLRRLGVW